MKGGLGGVAGRGEMLLDELRAALKGSRMSDTSQEVARRVLVDGVRQRDVSEEFGMSEPRVSAIVNSVRERAADRARVAEAQRESVQADYDIAVASVRKRMGAGVAIEHAAAGIAYRGPVVLRSEFFVAQDLGRGAAILHRLAALDVVPEVGETVRVAYNRRDQAMATVSRGRVRGEQERGR